VCQELPKDILPIPKQQGHGTNTTVFAVLTFKALISPMLLRDFKLKLEVLSPEALRASMGDKPGPTESTQLRGSLCVPMPSYRGTTLTTAPGIKNLTVPNAELHSHKVKSSKQAPRLLVFLPAVPHSARNLIKLPQQESTK